MHAVAFRPNLTIPAAVATTQDARLSLDVDSDDLQIAAATKEHARIDPGLGRRILEP
jgi:hypothetical protein